VLEQGPTGSAQAMETLTRWRRMVWPPTCPVRWSLACCRRTPIAAVAVVLGRATEDAAAPWAALLRFPILRTRQRATVGMPLLRPRCRMMAFPRPKVHRASSTGLRSLREPRLIFEGQY